MANATAVGSVHGNASFIYNVNDTATKVLIAKKMKENIYAPLLHRNGKGVNQVDETDASSVRMLHYKPFSGDARELGNATYNGGWFNADGATVGQIEEYDLNLNYAFDKMLDVPEFQEDMVGADLINEGAKNIGGRVNTEINASTLALQIKAKYDNVGAMTTPAYTGKAAVLASTPDYYATFLDASSILDDGDETIGIQSYPVEDRELIVKSSFRKALMSKSGVILGGSNFAQSMLANGGVDPESKKENGTFYIGELDLTPVYLCPAPIWNRAKVWLGTTGDGPDFVDNVEAILCAAMATDRGISTPSYVKIIDSPDGAGKRLQPKTRWGINVAFASGIVPILKNGTFLPGAAKATTGTYATSLTVTAPGNVSAS